MISYWISFPWSAGPGLVATSGPGPPSTPGGFCEVLLQSLSTFSLAIVANVPPLQLHSPGVLFPMRTPYAREEMDTHGATAEWQN